jgi:hypothetical protein
MTAYAQDTQRPAVKRLGIAGGLVIGGTVSSGMLLGGFAVAFMALTERVNGNALLLTSMGLFLVGAAIGLVVSAVFALAGRERDVTAREACHQIGLGVLCAVPGLAVGALLAGWIAMVGMAVYLGKAGPMIGSATAALLAAAVMLVTALFTLEAAGNAVQRVRRTA